VLFRQLSEAVVKVSPAAAHLRGQEVERLVDLDRGLRGGAPFADEPGREGGEAGHVSGIERRASLEGDREIDERKLVRRGEVDDRPVGEHVAMVGGLRRHVHERLELDRLGPRRQRGGGLPGLGECTHQAEARK